MATLIELATLSNAVYTKSADESSVGDWLQIAHSPDKADQDHHYYGAAYRNTRTDEIVIANRGTDPTNLKDLWSDVQLAAKQAMPAQLDAIAFARKIADEARSTYPGSTIVETGHSLGGYEDQAADAELTCAGLSSVSDTNSVDHNSAGPTNGALYV